MNGFPEPPPIVVHPEQNRPDAWYLRTQDGQTFGPVTRSQLQQWVLEQRINASCFVASSFDGLWQPAASLFPELASTQTSSFSKSFDSYCRNCGATVKPQQIACLSCGVSPMNGNRFCNHCRAETAANAIMCVKCGVSLGRGVIAGGSGKQIRATGNTLDPALAALLSLMLVGLGQMILGQAIKGVVMLVIALILGVLTGCIACLITFPVSAIDAYMIAKKLREGKSVGEWEFF